MERLAETDMAMAMVDECQRCDAVREGQAIGEAARVLCVEAALCWQSQQSGSLALSQRLGKSVALEW